MRSVTSPTLLIPGAALAALALTGCSVNVDAMGDTTRRVGSETIEAAGIERLELTTDNGRVSVRGGDVDEIVVDITYDEPDRGDATSNVRVDGEALVVTGACDKSWYQQCSVSFVVTVPDDIAVVADTDNGRIELTALAGAIDVYSDNGRIDATELSATSVRTRTDNGRIELAFATAPDDVDARTDNGSVLIRVPRATDGYAVHADTDSGDVDVEVDENPSATASIVAYSDNGSVTITGAGH